MQVVGAGAAEIWTVLAVETKGFVYLSDRRPAILFERHILHQQTVRSTGTHKLSPLTIGPPPRAAYNGPTYAKNNYRTCSPSPTRSSSPEHSPTSASARPYSRTSASTPPASTASPANAPTTPSSNYAADSDEIDDALTAKLA
ncbi:MAG: Peptidoglycan-binding domain 1 protein [Candidatus Solibacter sp.]|nr:Peptidoglycan-binding domain 1 protein [Candidatus Solibacter sp.]